MVELAKLEQDLFKCYEVVVEVATLNQDIKKSQDEYEFAKENPKLAYETDEDMLSTVKIINKLAVLIVYGVIGLIFSLIGLFVLSSGTLKICVVSGIPIVFLNLALLKNNEESILEDMEEHKKERDEELLEISKLENQVNKLRDKMSKYIEDERLSVLKSLILEIYMNVDAVENFFALIQNKRAESLEEAIKLYEEIKHSEEVEIEQNENLSDLQRKLAERSKELQGEARHENVVDMVSRWKKENEILVSL